MALYTGPLLTGGLKIHISAFAPPPPPGFPISSKNSFFFPSFPPDLYYFFFIIFSHFIFHRLPILLCLNLLIYFLTRFLFLYPHPLLEQVSLVPLRVLFQPLSVLSYAGSLPAADTGDRRSGSIVASGEDTLAGHSYPSPFLKGQ